VTARPRIAITTSRDSLAGLAETLAGLGYEVRWTPLLRFEDPDDWTPVDAAIARLETYGGIALTSPRAAAAFAGRVTARDASTRVPVHAWAGGAATALEWRRVGPATVAASDGELGAGEAVAGAILAAAVAGPILFPCGDARRDELPAALAAAGARVDEVVCYRSVLATIAATESALAGADAVVIGSPRVAALVAAARRPAAARLIALGPTTGRAMEAGGMPPSTVAERPTAAAVVAAIVGGARPTDSDTPFTPSSQSP